MIACIVFNCVLPVFNKEYDDDDDDDDDDDHHHHHHHQIDLCSAQAPTSSEMLNLGYGWTHFCAESLKSLRNAVGLMFAVHCMDRGFFTGDGRAFQVVGAANSNARIEKMKHRNSKKAGIEKAWTASCFIQHT